jgi:hypothetical protein
MSDDRTWLASVLFLDIISYSVMPVDGQLRVKRHFQDLVSARLHNLSDTDSIRLDTGDGMAICYLGDPEALFQVARGLRDDFVALESSSETPYQVRLGLNLGPVKIVEDLNQGRNCVGTGINDAQRVMSFAAPNQLLVSRSYFDMVSQLSQDYTRDLRHLGSREDKHQQQHEVYELAVEVVPVGQTISPTRQSSGSPGGSSSSALDPVALERIYKEYSSYMGSSTAQSIIDELSSGASSIPELCHQLAERMDSSDDRYSFNEFLKYYGYSGY